jgi:hypothetical protein
MSHQGEGSSRQKDPNESEEDTRLLNQAYVAVERYAKRESAFREFNVLKYKFMASFGAEHKELFEETQSAVTSIFIAGRSLASHYWPSIKLRLAPDYQQHINQMFKMEALLWESGENDETNTKLDSIQKKLEAATKACFEEQAPTYTLLTTKWKLPWKRPENKAR